MRVPDAHQQGGKATPVDQRKCSTCNGLVNTTEGREGGTVQGLGSSVATQVESPDEWRYTVRDVAAEVGLRERTVQYHAQIGILIGRQVGLKRIWKFRRADIDAYIQTGWSGRSR
jgi:hypothetical protein